MTTESPSAGGTSAFDRLPADKQRAIDNVIVSFAMENVTLRDEWREAVALHALGEISASESQRRIDFLFMSPSDVGVED